MGIASKQGRGTANNANNANAGCSDIASSLALAMHARDLRFLRDLRFPLPLPDPARYPRRETPARSLLRFGCGRLAALGPLRNSAISASNEPAALSLRHANCAALRVGARRVASAVHRGRTGRPFQDKIGAVALTLGKAQAGPEPSGRRVVQRDGCLAPVTEPSRSVENRRHQYRADPAVSPFRQQGDVDNAKPTLGSSSVISRPIGTSFKVMMIETSVGNADR